MMAGGLAKKTPTSLLTTPRFLLILEQSREVVRPKFVWLRQLSSKGAELINQPEHVLPGRQFSRISEANNVSQSAFSICSRYFPFSSVDVDL
jgi:hypothetical protein